jgi:hypothetical protein
VFMDIAKVPTHNQLNPNTLLWLYSCELWNDTWIMYRKGFRRKASSSKPVFASRDRINPRYTSFSWSTDQESNRLIPVHESRALPLC